MDKILEDMLPLEWVEKCFEELEDRDIDPDQASENDQDGSSSTTTHTIGMKGVDISNKILSKSDLTDLITGTRLTAGMLYLKALPNSSEKSLRTMRFLYRLYEGATLATPSLNKYLRQLVTESLRLALHLTVDLVFKFDVNDDHVEFSEEYFRIKKFVGRTVVLSGNESWKEALLSRSTGDGSPGDNDDKKEENFTPKITSLIMTQAKITNSITNLSDKFQIKTLTKVDTLKLGLIKISESQLQYLLVHNYYTKRCDPYRISEVDNIVKHFLMRGEEGLYFEKNFLG